MLDSKLACELLRSFPDVTEKDHFGGDGFYANKRIFATVWHEKKTVNVRLSKAQQKTFLEADGKAFVEINNAWGKQGWTTIQLDFVGKKLFQDAARAGWETSAAKISKSKSRPKSARRKNSK